MKDFTDRGTEITYQNAVFLNESFCSSANCLAQRDTQQICVVVVLIVNAVFLNFTSVVGGISHCCTEFYTQVLPVFSHTDVCNQGRRYLN